MLKDANDKKNQFKKRTQIKWPESTWVNSSNSWGRDNFIESKL
jgi:hypothetical protein